MKRILLSVAVLAFGSSAFSQVLYTQGTSDGSGIISSYIIDSSAAVACADDFTVPVGGTWNVNSVSVSGFRNDTGADITQVKVGIYQNSGGPGATIYEGDVTIGAVPCPTNDTTLVIPIPTTTLVEGTYWVSVYGYCNMTGRWNWSTSAGSFGATAMLIDPADQFGAGATSWTPLTSLGLTATALVFSIGGEGTMVGIDETEQIEVSVFPNPAVDVVTIQTPNNEFVAQVAIYDAAGKLVINHVNPGNTIDVSDLATGTYVLEISTASGTAQKRIVKK